MIKELINDFKKEVFSECVGYKPVYYRRKKTGDVYVYNKPIYRVMSNKEISSIIFKGFIGAVCVYIFLVLVIGYMPVSVN